MSEHIGLFAEQYQLVEWATEDFNKIVNIWNRYARCKPFKVKRSQLPNDGYEVHAYVSIPYPNELRKLVHNCTNAIKHSLDQVTNAFSRQFDPDCGELHFPWATSAEDLKGQLTSKKYSSKKHPIPDETFDLYKSFGCFYGEGGDKHFRDLAKAVNPGKHQLALAVRPVPGWDEVRATFKKGVPTGGHVELADPGLLKFENGQYLLAKGEGNFPPMKFNIVPQFVFSDPSAVEGEDVIELIGHSLRKTKAIIREMERWSDSRRQRSA